MYLCQIVGTYTGEKMRGLGGFAAGYSMSPPRSVQLEGFEVGGCERGGCSCVPWPLLFSIFRLLGVESTMFGSSFSF